jgi:hypothetical protein
MNNTMCRHLFTGSVLAIAGLCAGAARAEDVGGDLKATIALQGQPCDLIVASKRNADSDYSVSCKDGNHYHVYVNPQGRVVVEKQ